VKKESLRVWLALLLAERTVVSKVEQDLEARQIPLPWFEVLVRLAQAPHRQLRMQDLARQVLLSDSGTTRVVEKMEKASLIRRNSAADDQRGRVCSLTDKGAELFSELQPQFFRLLELHIGSKLSVRDQNLLADLLTKLARDES